MLEVFSNSGDSMILIELWLFVHNMDELHFFFFLHSVEESSETCFHFYLKLKLLRYLQCQHCLLVTLWLDGDITAQSCEILYADEI